MAIRKEIHEALKALQEGKTILYPTDTVWGIGCDATNELAVKRIFSIKKRSESKSMIILVDSLEMLQSIISNIPDNIITILKNTKTPTTYIFNNPKRIANSVIASDNTVAIRIVDDFFCKQLIHQFRKPIVSTSANISGNKTPANYNEIDPSIKKQVDYIVKIKQNNSMKKPSKIIRITKNTINIIRK